jgi:hypothetical protein
MTPFNHDFRFAILADLTDVDDTSNLVILSGSSSMRAAFLPPGAVVAAARRNCRSDVLAPELNGSTLAGFGAAKTGRECRRTHLNAGGRKAVPATLSRDYSLPQAIKPCIIPPAPSAGVGKLKNQQWLA